MAPGGVGNLQQALSRPFPVPLAHIFDTIGFAPTCKGLRGALKGQTVLVQTVRLGGLLVGAAHGGGRAAGLSTAWRRTASNVHIFPFFDAQAARILF